MNKLLVLSISSSLNLLCYAKIQCLDNNGHPVDWFIFYKLPHLYHHEDNFPISNGTGFMYFDVNNKNWKLMPEGMDVQNNAIYYTLQQFYTSNNTTTFSYLYNDEWPDSTIWSNSSAHAKGGLVFDTYSGFWLLHSIPKFPSQVEFRYPSNAYWYGQMGICVSMPFEALTDIAHQLFFYNTFTYHFNLPPYFAKSVPILNDLKAGKYQMQPPLTSTKMFRTLDGYTFQHFAKTGSWGQDLYADLISLQLRTSLKVETWNHQSGTEYNLPSQCSAEFQTLSAKYIQLPFNVSYSTYEDHSKFATAFSVSSEQPLKPYVCIADINRQSHQLHRGGGAICLLDNQIYSQYRDIISETVPCTKMSMPKVAVDFSGSPEYFRN